MAFAGKAAIVTGGGSGIGFQTSRHLLLAGVTVRPIRFDSVNRENIEIETVYGFESDCERGINFVL